MPNSFTVFSSFLSQHTHTYICFPPKIRRCWAGGIPSFSSTRSLMRVTCVSTRPYLVGSIDIQLDFCVSTRAYPCPSAS